MVSFAQEPLWFLDQLEPGNSMDNLPIAFHLTGKVNTLAFEQSINKIIERHESLRTVFATHDGRPVQVIIPSLKIQLSIVDLQALPEDEREEKARQMVGDTANQSFDLAHGPLVRVSLLKLSEEEHVFLLNMHHIITDGWSMEILLKELKILYEAYSLGKPCPLSEVPVQYTDYACWQREWLQGEFLENELNYWKQELNGAPAVLDLPTDRSRPPVQTFRGSFTVFTLSVSITEALKKLSTQTGNTFFMTLFAAFNVLLYRYTGKDDIVVGTPSAGRNRDELEGLIGYFVNALALRTDLSGNPTFLELLDRVWEKVLGAYDHQYLPFEKLLEELKPERNLAYNAVFQVMFDLNNFTKSQPELLGLTLSQFVVGSGTSKFDLTLTTEEREDGLVFLFQYNTDLFDAATIDRMIGHFHRLLTGIVDHPASRLADLPLLTEVERHQLLVEWNGTKRDFLPDQCLHHLFEAQTKQTPDKIGLVFQDQFLSYRQLNEMANQLAHYLRKLGVGPEVPVGICMERSVELIVGLLGILKAGGAYLPLNPDYPRERLNFLVKDAGIRVILTQKRLESNLPQGQVRVIRQDTDWDAISQESMENPAGGAEPRNLAYILYTSGSTGKPKGVLIEHRNIVTQLRGLQLIGNFNCDDRHLQVADFTFDMSVHQIFLPLVTGGTLFIITKEIMGDPLLFQEFLLQNGINVLDSTPALLSGLEYFTEQLPLKSISVGGEIFNLNLFETIKRKCRAEKVFNLYGPTETSVNATYYPCQNHETRNNIPIGSPMPAYQAFILDKFQNIVPIGIPGELCIAGEGVGRGYLNRPELTAEKFIPISDFGFRISKFKKPQSALRKQLRIGVRSKHLKLFNPQSEISQSAICRMYRTGDLVRWLPDGKIDFLGRIDLQVKIRGFRIELEEIEAILNQHSLIQEAIVIVREDRPGDKRLVAYAVLKDERLEARELRNYLREKLPDYMVPSHFVFLKTMPLTSNGKIDRRALPAPERLQSETEENLVAPRTPTEEVLAEIWAGVLGLNRISVFDNFFEAGGHSLLAIQVISKVRDAFQVEIPVRSLFKAPTLAGLAQQIEEARQVEQSLSVPPIQPVSHEGDPVLSFSQERLWFLDQLEPGSAAYNIPFFLRLTGNLNQLALEQSLNRIIERHETLRTIFAAKDGRPVQVILPEYKIRIQVISLQELPENEREEKVNQLAKAEARFVFDLARVPLVRVSLLKLSEEKWILLLNMHHIISDGWSMGLFFNELGVLYESFVQGKPSPLPEIKVQFADYAYWQREWLQGEVLEKQLSYWKQKLSGAPAVLDLPTDHPRPPVQTFRGFFKVFRISVPLTKALKRLTVQEGNTLFMTCLAMFNVLLYLYSGQEDLVVGAPVAGRNRSEIEDLIGFFVNTLALRTDLSGAPSFRTLLSRVHEMVLESYAHQDLPFEKLVEELKPDRNLGYSPVFQVAFAFQNYELSPLKLPGLTLSPVKIGTGTAKFDLILFMGEYEEGMYGEFEYNTDLFDATTVERMCGHFLNIMEKVVEKPDLKLLDIEMITEAEKQQLFHKFNNTAVEYPKDRTIHELFIKQAEETTEKEAIIYKDRSLTYRELDQKTNQLARVLRNKGIGPDSIVGLMVNRSMEMVIGTLGILKAGGAYLPIDPNYPPERIKYMVDDSKIRVILTHDYLKNSTDLKTDLVCLEDHDLYSGAALDLEITAGTPSGASNLAYVMYTSGSTGEPKGVMVEHGNVVRLVKNPNFIQFKEEDRILQTGAITFDATTFELWGALLNGLTLCLVDEKIILDDSALEKALADYQISILWLTSPLFNQLSQENPGMFRRIRYLLVGGDVLSPKHINKVRNQCPGINIINGYGPTENTTFSTCFLVKEDFLNNIPIGKPISNSSAYILNQNKIILPVGVIGELWVGGDGVSRGYLNNPELTAEKFVPFNSLQLTVDSGKLKDHYKNNYQLSTVNSQLIYKTGDLARWLPDGNIEFLGRADHQVKIRGFRIELGEIESQLLKHEFVKEAVVLDRKDGEGEKYLCAYLVAGKNLPTTELREYLSQFLPGYMLPAYYVQLEKLPLAPNGKIDRRVLPVPEKLRFESGDKLVAPRTPIEEVLAVIWAQVLGLEQIGVFDNFFELGGHSLLATRVISKIRDAFRVEIPVRGLFETPTVEGFAQQIEEMRRVEQNLSIPPFRPVSRAGDLPLSFSQERLWFLDQLEPGGATYNIPLLLRLTGNLDPPALEKSLNAIIDRHESLRTIFNARNGSPVQVIIPELRIRLLFFDLRELPENEREEKARQLARNEAKYVFDLTRGPLVRANLLKLSEKEYFLLLNMHHIISDGWSMGIFFKELAIFYEAFSLGKPSPLSELSIQYADFASWQKQWLHGEVLEEQLRYWRQKLNQAPAVLDLPTDRPRPPVQTFRGAYQSWSLSRSLTQALKKFNVQDGRTLFMTCLAAFQVLLSRYSRQDDLVVGTPVAGRNRSEIEDLIGFFVNTLVLRTNLSGNPSFRELLGRVWEIVLDAYTRQDLPFEKLVEELKPERNLTYPPIFQVMFAFENFPIPLLELPGLTLSPVGVENETSKFDLTLFMSEREEGLAGSFEYNTDLFDGATIGRMIGHLTNILEQAAGIPAVKLSEIEILTATEKREILSGFNQTGAEFRRDVMIYDLFEEQMERTPAQIALIFEGQEITYQELSERTNQLALFLRQIGVGRGTLVAVIMERSLEMVTGVMGILKAGGAYVPFETHTPKGRIEKILDDLQIRHIITQRVLLGMIGELEFARDYFVEIICPGGDAGLSSPEITGSLAQEVSDQNLRIWTSWDINRLPNGKLAVKADPDDWAYIIYTSGSTGVPKGVVVRHRPVINLIEWVNRTFWVGSADRLLFVTSLCFDLSVYDIFGILAAGGSIRIASRGDLQNPENLYRILCWEPITFWDSAPAALQQLVPFFGSVVNFGTNRLRLVFLSGDWIPVPLPDLLRNTFPGVKVISLGGATEATVWSNYFPVGVVSPTWVSIPYGKPIQNARYYILDDYLQPCPIGIPGDLYIGGECLADGYINDPALTADKYLPDPFVSEGTSLQTFQTSNFTLQTSRIYRTGDLARWFPDGNIEFLGRKDFQVKIRGFRVELGEIEAQLINHPLVEEAVVVARVGKNGDKYLCAYLVSETELTVSDLRGHLAKELPEYMIPSFFVSLEKLPLTANGKVDRRALPEPDGSISTGVTYAAPRNETEESLAVIWQEILGVGKVGVQDNFFDLGGHSLLVIRLLDRVEKNFQKKLPPATLFGNATIAALAGVIDWEDGPAMQSSLVPIQPSGSKPPLFFVHPILGDVLLFYELARALGPEQPFYGLQAAGIDGEREPYAGIEEMAGCYLRELQTIQPVGPYLLGGYSAGGAVAFEMARQLREQGQEIGLLVVVDGASPSYKAYLSNVDESDLLMMFFEQLAGSLGNEIPADLLSKIKRHNHWDDMLEEIRRMNILPAEITGAQIHHRLRVFRSFGKALQEYPVKRYEGPIVLFRSGAELARAEDPPLLKWDEVAAGGVGMEEIPGNHTTILKEPNVRILAEKLKECLG